MHPSLFSDVLAFVRSCGPNVRVGIVGSRDYPAPWLVGFLVRELPTGSMIVSGASGAVDETAAEVADACGLGFSEFPPHWSSFGRAAGPVRNKKLVHSGLCCLVVFLSSLSEPSAGATSAIQYALQEGIPVFRFGPDEKYTLPKLNGSCPLSHYNIVNSLL